MMGAASATKSMLRHCNWREFRYHFDNEQGIIMSGLTEAVAMGETGELDSSYVSVLLATFRSFTTTKDFLDTLLAR